MFKIGQILHKQNYTQGAVWCNQNGAHIEKRDGTYMIVRNAPQPEPNAQELVAALEAKYGLPRAVRTALLALCAQGLPQDPVLMARVNEIEAAAASLRAAEAGGGQ